MHTRTVELVYLAIDNCKKELIPFHAASPVVRILLPFVDARALILVGRTFVLCDIYIYSELHHTFVSFVATLSCICGPVCVEYARFESAATGCVLDMPYSLHEKTSPVFDGYCRRLLLLWFSWARGRQDRSDKFCMEFGALWPCALALTYKRDSRRA